MTAPVLASVSLDLDDKWSYLKTHGDPTWRELPSFLPVVVDRMLTLLDDLDIQATFFVVGRDADQPRHAEMLRSLRDRGHEVGNHSYWHEPWLHRYDAAQTREELTRTHEAITAAVGDAPVGFRGPGYSLSIPTLRTLQQLEYHYDASLLPTWIGPLARAWYLRSADLTDDEDRAERAALFGSWRDGALPLRPFRWDVPGASLVEVPVTTLPIFRLPIHVTYLLYLHQVSPHLARAYLRTAVRLCELRGIGPSMLLHPLEFLDPSDAEVRGLEFLPGVAVSWGAKRTLLLDLLTRLQARFSMVTLSTQASALSAKGLPSRLPALQEEPA